MGEAVEKTHTHACTIKNTESGANNGIIKIGKIFPLTFLQSRVSKVTWHTARANDGQRVHA